MTRVTEFGFDEEYSEEATHQYIHTNWPKPLNRLRFVYEMTNQSVEETYFWILDDLREEIGFDDIEKITDLFSAAEQSAFFGAAYQKISLQQDKVMQFLTATGKMVKELFQLVRELRVIDERVELYDTSYKGVESSEITLKGYWVDMVEQGAKNPASVYGMAREVQFTTLPDLFFSAFPRRSEDVDSFVDPIEFNRKVREVLKRKLKAFLIWKEHTYREIKDRRLFTLKYLRQHYDIIRMYMTWIKPYLRNIRRLQMDMTKMDTPHLVSAFEGSMVEIEILAKKPLADNKVFACISAHFEYRSRPEMSQYQQQQRSAVHVGRTVMSLRSYIWTKEELERYKRFKMRDDFDLISTIDKSIEAAMVAFGDELERYLMEAEELFLPEWKKKEKEEKAKLKEGPFSALGKSFQELFTSFSGTKQRKCAKCGYLNKMSAARCYKCKVEFPKKLSRKEKDIIKLAKEDAEGLVIEDMSKLYEQYKEAHNFLHFYPEAVQ